MIHSMAGGQLGRISSADLAKVRITEGINSGDVFWYVSKIPMLKAGDLVFVPLKEKRVKGVVERIDKNVSSQVSPIPLNKARQIICKINNTI